MCVANHKATYQIKIRYFFGAKTLATHVCLFMTVFMCEYHLLYTSEADLIWHNIYVNKLYS